jgi:tRNA-specific 2-thiouridylase
LRAFAKVRLAHRPAPCLVRRLGGKSVQIRFDSPERALAPGQSVVIYHEDGRVLGGGTIDAALEHVD